MNVVGETLVIVAANAIYTEARRQQYGNVPVPFAALKGSEQEQYRRQAVAAINAVRSVERAGA